MNKSLRRAFLAAVVVMLFLSIVAIVAPDTKGAELLENTRWERIVSYRLTEDATVLHVMKDNETGICYAIVTNSGGFPRSTAIAITALQGYC